MEIDKEKARQKVIVALDHTDVHAAKRMVDELDDLIEWFKVGPVLFTAAGTQILEHLHKKNKKIFLDLKLHDIPNVVGKTVRQIGDLGVRFLTVHTMGGRRMLEAASESCREAQIQLLGVTLLTSHEKADSDFLGWTEESADIVVRLSELAMESRLSGIICSPHELRRARSHAVPGFLLVTPGIRMPSKEVYQDDQKRVATPREAIEWGADYIVMGRPITEAREPRDVVQQLFD